MEFLPFYLALGSYAAGIWLWFSPEARTARSVAARQHATQRDVADGLLKMPCPSCGGHIKFASQNIGKSIPCPALPKDDHFAQTRSTQNGLLLLPGTHRIPGARHRGKNALPTLQNGHHFEGAKMNSKLKHIQNWPALAREVKWSANKLAKQCKVSKDSLRRHFLQHMGEPPRTWLAEQRQYFAIGILHNGSSIKGAATLLGYKYQTKFTRKFKEFWGACPTLPLRHNNNVPVQKNAKMINTAAK